jgi:O-antigen chain-terminating methyltransferase
MHDFFNNHDRVLYNQCLQSAEIPDDYARIGVGKPQNLFFRLALKHKKTLLAIPVLRRIAIIFKNKYYVQNEPTIATVFSAEKYFQLNYVDFIHVLYRKLLGRDVEKAGLDAHVQSYLRGGSKEAIVYSIYLSAEFNNRFIINNIDKYKKAYKKFQRVTLLRQMPFISTYNRLRVIDRLMIDMYDFTSHRHTHILNEIASVREGAAAEIASVREGVAAEIASVHEGVFAEIASVREGAAAEIASVRSRSDNLYGAFEPYIDVINSRLPQSTISKGTLEIDSYLDKARESLSEKEMEYISSCSFDDRFFYYMAKLFRGSEQSLYKVFDNYMEPLIKAIDTTGNDLVIDLGCGKGDWMNYLRSHGISAKGVDINEASARFAIDAGFDVAIDDINNYLEGLSDKSVAAVTMLSVSEHLTHEEFKTIIAKIPRVIAVGGVFIMDMPNPYCYFQVGGFYTDPSHITWISPEPAKLLLEMVGFCKVYSIYYSPFDWMTKSPEKIYNYRAVSIIAEKGEVSV